MVKVWDAGVFSLHTLPLMRQHIARHLSLYSSLAAKQTMILFPWEGVTFQSLSY